MRPAASVGGDALDPVHAALELQSRIGALPRDLGDRLLDAAPGALADRDQVELPAPPLRVAGIHPEQVAGEEGRLVAAGAGADLEDHVTVVVRVARHEQPPELGLDRLLPRLEHRELLARHAAHLLVGVVRHRAGRLQLIAHRGPGADRVDHRLEPRQLAAERLEPRGVAGRRRRRHLGDDRVVARLDLAKPVDHRARPAGAASRSEARHDSSDAMLTSSMPWSGGRVVSDCSHSPGA